MAPPRDAAPYRELLTDFLQRKVELFGRVALTRARGIAGLHVLDSGVVTGLDGDPLEVLGAVLATFERLSGRVSTISARTAVHRLRLRERYPDVELPPSLR